MRTRSISFNNASNTTGLYFLQIVRMVGMKYHFVISDYVSRGRLWFNDSCNSSHYTGPNGFHTWGNSIPLDWGNLGEVVRPG